MAFHPDQVQSSTFFQDRFKKVRRLRRRLSSLDPSTHCFAIGCNIQDSSGPGTHESQRTDLRPVHRLLAMHWTSSGCHRDDVATINPVSQCRPGVVLQSGVIACPRRAISGVEYRGILNDPTILPQTRGHHRHVIIRFGYPRHQASRPQRGVWVFFPPPLKDFRLREIILPPLAVPEHMLVCGLAATA